jgi:hypothetical protein
MSEVQKAPEDIFAGKGKKKYKVLYKFSCNLRSKLARSTLTSPSPIRVKRTVRRDLRKRQIKGVYPNPSD